VSTAGVRHSRPAFVVDVCSSNSSSDINFAARFSAGASTTTRDSVAVVVHNSMEQPNLNPNDQLVPLTFFGAVTVITSSSGPAASSTTEDRATGPERPDRA